MTLRSYLLAVVSTLLLGLSLIACQNKQKSGDAQAMHSLPLQYAQLLHIEEADSFTKVTVQDAWHPQATLATYLLINRNLPLPAQLPEGTVVRVPLQRVALLSSVHTALLTNLRAESCIAALADTAYLVSKSLRTLARSVKSIGSSMQPDLEQLRALQADAVWVSPFENAGHGSLSRLGTPLIECADYMESSPLARAEWMRFYGRLVGRAAEADSLFLTIERRYLDLRQKASKLKPQPTVFCDLRTGGTWYQPGGHSTMGQFIADAGGRYLWADRPESGSLQLDFESVFSRAHAADIWLLKYGRPTSLTYASLAGEFNRYTQFRPWRERHILACNTMQKAFYEEVPFHPERLLANLICVFHPAVAPQIEQTVRYYEPLAN